MRTMSVVGARPQFIKLAPVSRAMRQHNDSGGEQFDDIVVHTGQHYDAAMSDVFFDELELPEPQIDLGVGSGSHGVQTARMLEAMESCIEEHRPDVVIIYGDTNSTVAAALAAAKLNTPIAHIEAGLRSFNRAMPEEVNRIVADHLSQQLYAPTQTAMDNLVDENLASRSHLSGDVMLDAVEFNRDLALQKSRILDTLGVTDGEYIVATIHRPVNTDGENLRIVLDSLAAVGSTTRPVLLLAHPRTVARMKSPEFADWQAADGLRVVEPVGAMDMLRLLDSCHLAITDSGGLQKEALFLGAPCVTVRDETEWPETITAGGNRLSPATQEGIAAAVQAMSRKSDSRDELQAAARQYFGNADAAERIVRSLLEDIH